MLEFVGTQSAEWVAMARLVRRTGFGATGRQVDAALKVGAGGYVAQLLAADPESDPGAIRTPIPAFPPITPAGKTASAATRAATNQQISAQLVELAGWWVRRMVAVDQPFGEKLTFCWHNHFATAATKVRHAQWLADQNQTLRRLGRGDFRALALAMLTDAALVYWLDGQKNVSSAPNENLSREFMELFALGHDDGYTETDVREGARALTGWKIRTDGSTHLVESLHDQTPKTFLGVTGNLDVTGYCDAVLARPGSPGYLATRWWGQLVSGNAPASTTVSAVATAYGPARDLTALFRTLLTRPEFAAAQGSLVVDPVEWLIGIVRALQVPVPDDAAARKLLGTLRLLGQLPFYPPNVGGWPSGQAWLSTAAADGRIEAARSLARAGDLSTVADASPADRIDALGYLLGVGSWTARTTAALKAAGGDPAELVTAGVNSPEYLVQ